MLEPDKDDTTVTAYFDRANNAWRIDLHETILANTKEEAERIASYKLSIYHNGNNQLEKLKAKLKQAEELLKKIKDDTIKSIDVYFCDAVWGKDGVADYSKKEVSQI